MTDVTLLGNMPLFSGDKATKKHIDPVLILRQQFDVHLLTLLGLFSLRVFIGSYKSRVLCQLLRFLL